MGTKLDQIETKLQTLIESSVRLFAQGDAQHRLAHELVEAVQENIIERRDGRTIAPNVFTIHLHPDSLAYWQTHLPLLDAIARSLSEVVREQGVQFLNEPVLRLSPDPDMSVEGIQIVASSQHEPSGHTAAFNAQPAPSQNALPKNAFLMVGGDQIYPLNRSVINIGRRSDNHLVIADPRVSRAHAQIRSIRGQYILFDLNSTGGTMVNGRAIHQYTLKPGDVISLSGVPLIYGEDFSSEEESGQTGSTQTMNSSNPPPEEIE